MEISDEAVVDKEVNQMMKQNKPIPAILSCNLKD